MSRVCQYHGWMQQRTGKDGPRSRTLGAAALAAAGLLLLGGCGGRSGHPLVLAVGGAPDELAVWQELVTAFSESSGTRVEILRQPANTAQRRQGLVVALAARRPDPDLFLMDVAWIGLFSAANWLRPLEGVDTTAFFPDILQAADRRGNELIALPIDLDIGLLYDRSDLLRHYDISGPPATYAELRRTAIAVQAAVRPHHPGFYGFAWQGAQYEGLVVDFLEFAGTQGGFVSRGGGWIVDVPANRQALQFMHDLIWKDRISPPSTYTEMREEQVRRFFQRGDALYERNWPYAWALHQAPDSPVRGRVGVSPLPAPATGGAVSILGGWHVGISRFSDAPERARDLVRYLTSPAVQREMVLRLGWYPGRRDLYEDPQLRSRLPLLADLWRAFRHVRTRPVVPYYPQLSEVLQSHLSAVLADRSTPERALAAADEELARLVRRYAPDPAGKASAEASAGKGAAR